MKLNIVNIISFPLYLIQFLLIYFHLHSGPQTVSGIKQHFPNLKIDVHVVSASPHTLVLPLATARTDRFTFQFEIAEGGDIGDKNWGKGIGGKIDIMGSVPVINKMVEKEIKKGNEANKEGNKVEKKEEKEIAVSGAVRMAVLVRRAGMLCGVCIAPSTDAYVLDELLCTYYCTDTGAVRYGRHGEGESGGQGEEGVLGERASYMPSTSSPPPSSTSSSSIPSSTPSSTLPISPWVPLVDYVDLLAVSPGIGGQTFDYQIIEKVIFSILL